MSQVVGLWSFHWYLYQQQNPKIEISTREQPPEPYIHLASRFPSLLQGHCEQMFNAYYVDWFYLYFFWRGTNLLGFVSEGARFQSGFTVFATQERMRGKIVISALLPFFMHWIKELCKKISFATITSINHNNNIMFYPTFTSNDCRSLTRRSSLITKSHSSSLYRKEEWLVSNCPLNLHSQRWP